MKNNLLFILGIITGIFILPGILKWLGLPSFADVLTMVFGEPNVVNKVIVGLVGLVLVIYLVRVFVKQQKS